ncbi:MAG TPA: prolyl oligopeptidase family serine peptidase [Terriglobales bacterium]|nr:prolyl oligopeptidase family serine peptidase [Terriglobales bacterium]
MFLTVVLLLLLPLVLMSGAVAAQTSVATNTAQTSAAAAGSATGASATTSAPAPTPPKTKIAIVEDTLHGHKIVDPYRYLENGDDPATQEFGRDQYAYTRAVLDPLPGRDRMRARLTELLSIGTLGVSPQIAGGWYFYTRRDAGQNQPVLYARKGVDGRDRVLVDVNKMAADATIALDYWTVSDDGKYVVSFTSPSGTEHCVIRILETATGQQLPEEIYVGRGRSLAFLPDNSGFYYTRFPKKGTVPAGEEMYNPRIFYHKLGTAPDGSEDKLVFGEGLHPQHWPSVSLSEDGRWMLIQIFQGWTKTELKIKDLKSDGPFVDVTSGKDFLYTGFVYKGDVYIHTNEDAPKYRVFRVAAENPARTAWKEIIPETENVLQTVALVGGKLVTEYQKNAASLVKVFTLEGKPAGEVPLPTLGTVGGIGGQHDSPQALINFHSYTVPPVLIRYDIADGKTGVFAKIEAPIDPSPYEVKQVWYTSKDGTKVPMFIVSRKGLKLDGNNPTLLYGYGGFQQSMTPQFRRSLFLWLDAGGVYAEANLRGGSEFGEEWHRAGMLEKKQNVFDDFIAAAEYLIQEKYTNKDRLAIQGGSNGGLLVGAALTQRPELFRAVVCQVPLLDMLRYQNFQIAKLWIPEYGSAEDPKQFDFLYAYSPYHRVKEGTEYPAILITTAESDTRVDPMHSRKMTARLQAVAKNGADRPILLRIEPKAGHGQGKPVSKQIEEGIDVWSFLFWQLGVKQ